MELTKRQLEGLNIAIQRYKNKEKYTVISGFAGTGKSTLIKFIVAALGEFGIDPNIDVGYCAPTGKAANELVKKGNSNATTLHKLLWEWRPLPHGGFFKKAKDSLEYKVVIVDETSMVPIDIIKQLLKHHVYIIFAGDPGQLPPISKNDNNHLLDKPHVFLDEIMRQALDSEIIRLSMLIREGKPINPQDYHKDVMIIDRKDLNTSMLTWADQVICATNKTRTDLNMQMRGLLNHTSNFPEEGDKVISLHNEWDIFDDEGNALVNGTIGWLKQPEQVTQKLPYFWGGNNIDVTYSHLVTEQGSTFINLNMDTNMILTGEKCVDWQLAYKINKSKGKYGVITPLEFTYGYCITCWKAQGAQWDKVLLIEEGHPFDKEEHKKFLYTGCTRAANKLVLVRK